MLMPRKVRHRKVQRGRSTGTAKGGTRVTFGDYGIQALEPGWITNRQIEAARIAMTRYIKRGGKVEEYGGPFPCLKYSTMRDLLDAKSVTWKFYALKVYPWTQCPKCQGAGIWSAFDAIKAVRYSSEWDKNVSQTPNEIFSDINKNKLPDVAWVTPTGDNSDHTQTGKDTGPSWVGSIVNAGTRSYEVVGELEDSSAEGASAGEIPSLDWNRAIVVPLGAEPEAAAQADIRYPIDVAVAQFAGAPEADRAS